MALASQQRLTEQEQQWDDTRDAPESGHADSTDAPR